MSEKQNILLSHIRATREQHDIEPLEVIAACGMALGEAFAEIPDDERAHYLVDFIAMVLAQQGYPEILLSE